ncbi:hypothetical protein ACWEPD_19015 [Streptomyces pseudogriseolus]|uniref:hypothetical protein n=1 Tax=Streptomyces pseudogriseolus TaxID=36817 RepID=UPI003489D706|nr:hypothetical protein [Streptomyces pseudogriseolus]
MSTPDDKDLSHPLEQETGEKDVPPEEERRDEETSGGVDTQDSDDASGGRP